MGDTYRETALEQAVISHGQIEVPMSAPHTNYRAPNDPAQVVKAATAYEAFLDRPGREAEDLADRLAAALAPLAQEADGAELGGPAAEALDAWRKRKADLEEPF